MKQLLRIGGILTIVLLSHACRKDNSLPVPTEGLVAYYPFNGNANDESGNGNHGTMISGSVLTKDKNGAANRACSVNPGYVEIPDNNSLDLTNFTLCIWFKPEAIYHAFSCLIGKNYAIAYALGFDSGGSADCPAPVNIKRPMVFYAGHKRSEFATSDFTCGSNTWYHAAVTYNNSTGTIQLYVDGVLTGTVSGVAGSIGNSSDPLGIGADGHYTDKFLGVVDEVCIYDRVLSSSEISQIYSAY